MSEEPRLSRRQLREMGELSVRDASTPSLTETEELRLRRPSRRELREAERANEEAEKRIRESAIPVHAEHKQAEREQAEYTPADGVTSVADAAPDQVAERDDRAHVAPAGDVTEERIEEAGERPGEAAGEADAAGTHAGQAEHGDETSFGAFFEDFGVSEENAGTSEEADTAKQSVGVDADDKSVQRVAEELSSSDAASFAEHFGDDASRSDAVAFGAAEEAVSDGSVGGDQPAVVLERKSVFDRFDDEPDVDAQAQETTGSLQERLIQRTGEDLFEHISDADLAPTQNAAGDASAESAAESSAAAMEDKAAESAVSEGEAEAGTEDTANADVESSQEESTQEAQAGQTAEDSFGDGGSEHDPAQAASHQRDSDLATHVDGAEGTNVSIEGTDEAASAHSTAASGHDAAAGDAGAAVETVSDADAATSPADPEATTEIDSASVAASTVELGKKTPAAPAAQKGGSAKRDSAQAGSAPTKDDVVTVDTHEGSPAFGWLVLLILIIIGALIGYLGGTWISATWLSAPEAGLTPVMVDSVVAGRALL